MLTEIQQFSLLFFFLLIIISLLLVIRRFRLFWWGIKSQYLILLLFGFQELFFQKYIKIFTNISSIIFMSIFFFIFYIHLFIVCKPKGSLIMLVPCHFFFWFRNSFSHLHLIFLDTLSILIMYYNILLHSLHFEKSSLTWVWQFQILYRSNR